MTGALSFPGVFSFPGLLLRPWYRWLREDPGKKRSWSLLGSGIFRKWVFRKNGRIWCCLLGISSHYSCLRKYIYFRINFDICLPVPQKGSGELFFSLELFLFQEDRWGRLSQYGIVLTGRMGGTLEITCCEFKSCQLNVPSSKQYFVMLPLLSQSEI